MKELTREDIVVCLEMKDGDVRVLKVPDENGFSHVISSISEPESNVFDEIICYNHNINFCDIKKWTWITEGFVICGKVKEDVKILGWNTEEAKEIIGKYGKYELEEVEEWKYPRGL